MLLWLGMNLIIINGPCGVGKSTVAELLHKTIPLSFLLEGDALRRLVSGYKEYREESKQLSSFVAMSIIETYLQTGHDVIVDKIIFDEEYLDRMTAIGISRGARVSEIILWASKDFVMKRAADRGYRENGLLTPEKCERFWHEIDALKIKRPHATVIDVEDLLTDEVVERIRKILI